METRCLCLALVLFTFIFNVVQCQEIPPAQSEPFYSKPSFTYTMGNEVLHACGEVIQNAVFHSGDCPGSPYPGNTTQLTLRGKWENSAKDLDEESPLINGQKGTFDFWEQHDTPTSHKAYHNMTGMLYLMRRSGKKNDDYHHFVTVQGEGVYIPCMGIICMIGCYNKQESQAIPDEMVPEEELEEEGAEELALDEQEEFNAEHGETKNFYPPSDTPVEAEESGFEFPTLDTTWKMDTSGDCSVRILLQFEKEKKLFRPSLIGNIQSVLPKNDTEYFPKITFTGHSINTSAEVDWYWFEIFGAVMFLLVGLACTFRQVLWTRKCAAAQYTSLSMVGIQLVVGLYIWARELYFPFMFMAFDVLWYQFTSFAAIPRFISLAIIIVQLTLILAIRRRRRLARADYADPKLAPTEMPVLISCVPLYIVGAVLFWYGEDRETFLKVIQYLHLTPQIVSNVAWDTSAGPRPIHPVYSIGLSLVQILNLTFDTYRPAFLGYVGYDDLYDFPHDWYAAMVLLIVSQVVLLLCQQAFGGRCLVPQKYRGSVTP